MKKDSYGICVYVYKLEYYSALKRKEMLTYAV